jgi:hypothetical protein
VKDALGRPTITKNSKKIKSMKAVFESAYNLTDALGVGLVNHLPYNVDVAGMFKGPLLLFTVVRHPVSTFHSLFTYRSCYRLPGATWETCGNNFDLHKEFVDAVRQRDTLENRWAFAKEQPPNRIYDYIRGGASSVETAAAQYDFIFVTERMDEGEHGSFLFLIQLMLNWLVAVK